MRGRFFFYFFFYLYLCTAKYCCSIQDIHLPLLLAQMLVIIGNFLKSVPTHEFEAFNLDRLIKEGLSTVIELV